MTQRIKMSVYVDLDDMEGAFHTPIQAAKAIHFILMDRIPHYRPVVSLSTTGPVAGEGIPEEEHLRQIVHNE